MQLPSHSFSSYFQNSFKALLQPILLENEIAAMIGAVVVGTLAMQFKINRCVGRLEGMLTTHLAEYGKKK